MGRLGGAAGQWLVAGALYLGFAGTADTAEVATAASTAAFILGFVLWCRRARGVVIRTRPSWLRILPRLLRTLAIETALFGGALVPVLLGTRRHGVILAQPFDPGRKPTIAASRPAPKLLAVCAIAAGVLLGLAVWHRNGRAMLSQLRTRGLRSLRLLRGLDSEAGIVGGSLLAMLLESPGRGGESSKPFAPDVQSAAEAGRRGIAVLAASAAPDGYVVAVREDSLLLHRLVPRPTSPDHRWPI